MPQALFRAGAPERWLRADSGRTLHAPNSPQTHGGGRGSAVWICRFWARGSHIGEANSFLKLSTASEVWFLPKTAQPSCSKGTAVFSGGGATAQGTGERGWAKSVRLERLSLEAESSSSVLAAGNRSGAVHLLRADPCSWEKQHKRQHGFPLSNTGLFTQADKRSGRAERDTQRI